MKALKKRLSSLNTELPDAVRGYLDIEPEKTYSLIFETKNLHVESTFEPVRAQEKRQEIPKRAQQYMLSPLTTYQQEKKQKKVELVTVCPQR